MATAETYWVRLDSTAGGDGTEDRTDGATRAFASLDEARIWLEANRADISLATGTDKNITIRCSIGAAAAGTLDTHTASVLFEGITTQAGNEITIRPKAGQEAGKTWDDTKYGIAFTAVASGYGISAGGVTKHFNVYQLQIRSTKTAGNFNVTQTGGLSTSGVVRFLRNLIDCVFSGTANGIAHSMNGGSGVVCYFQDNIVLGLSNATSTAGAIRCTASGTLYAYNNTIKDALVGLGRTAGSFKAVNNIMPAATTPGTGTFAAGSGYNFTNQDFDTIVTVLGTGSVEEAGMTFDADGVTPTAEISGSDVNADASWVIDDVFGDDYDQPGTVKTGTWTAGAVEYDADTSALTFVTPHTTLVTAYKASVEGTPDTASLNISMTYEGGTPAMVEFDWSVDAGYHDLTDFVAGGGVASGVAEGLIVGAGTLTVRVKAVPAVLDTASVQVADEVIGGSVVAGEDPMFDIFVVKGSTECMFRVKLRDINTGQGLTGLGIATSGFKIAVQKETEAAPVVYAVADSELETIATLGQFVEPTSGKLRFREVSAADRPGIYEVQGPAALVGDDAWESVEFSFLGAANLREREFTIRLTKLPLDTAPITITDMKTGMDETQTAIDVAAINASVDQLITAIVDNMAEPVAPPAADAPLYTRLLWAAVHARNQKVHDRSTNTETLYANDGETPIGERDVTQVGDVVTAEKWVAPA